MNNIALNIRVQDFGGHTVLVLWGVDLRSEKHVLLSLVSPAQQRVCVINSLTLLHVAAFYSFSLPF